jgi:DNA-binding cell septation regulator SpoVG
MNMKILEVALVKTKSEKVKARADIHFDGFLLKGFKVIQVTPPSYQAGPFWRQLFKTDSEDDWKEIQRTVLDKFEKLQMEESFDEALKQR